MHDRLPRCSAASEEETTTKPTIVCVCFLTDTVTMSSGHGYKNKSRFPLTAAMTEGKPQQQFIERDGAGRPSGDATITDKGAAGSNKPDLGANANASARLANPLGDLSEEEVQQQAEAFAQANNLPVETFRKGALLAKAPHKWRHISSLTDEERTALEREVTHKYDQPWVLYNLVLACSVAAAVQGMDESVIS